MKTVSVAEARSRLKALLDEVSSGQEVSVVRRGREVARLVPPTSVGTTIAARGWLAQFSLPLRALDALHLAVADAEGLRLATTDRDLSRSARRLGVAVTLFPERRLR